MFQQLFHSWSQVPVAYSREVIEGEEVQVFSEVTWKAVELVQHPDTHTQIDTLIMSIYAGRFVCIINVKPKTCASKLLTL